MIEFLVLSALLILGFSLGYRYCLAKLKPKLDQLARLTDRDERGRFKGGPHA